MTPTIPRLLSAAAARMAEAAAATLSDAARAECVHFADMMSVAAAWTTSIGVAKVESSFRSVTVVAIPIREPSWFTTAPPAPAAVLFARISIRRWSMTPAGDRPPWSRAPIGPV